MQKKLLLLGGSAQQVVAIDTAKRLGYTTVLCDYLPDNPGQYHSDVFYQVSTTDKEAILAVARKENISGIIAYASDPAAPTAAYVAEKMGLPTNPYASVEILCNKDKFRAFLRENAFNSPRAGGFSSKELAVANSSCFSLPVIIKPVDSSGSKGATVLHNWNELDHALDFAFSFSRSHRVIIEEFIEKSHPFLIGGDILVVGGNVVLWGLMNCHRDQQANPLVPTGKSYPPVLSAKELDSVKMTLQKMVDVLGITMGAINVELIVDSSGRVWPIDVGPRNGGNMIPNLLELIFGVNVVELSVKAAMGDRQSISAGEGKQFYATHNLHALKNGIYRGVKFSEEIEQFIVQKCIYKQPGDEVEFFDNASKALGIIFLKFGNETIMLDTLNHIHEHIQIITE